MRPPRHRLVGAAAAVLVSVAAIGAHTAPAGAESAPLACGEVVTADVTLTAPLSGCSTGLVVGADGITIDLNGHAIEGAGSASGGVGVEAVGRTGVTVRNGRIAGFTVGVRLHNSPAATVEGLAVAATETGISLSSAEPSVANSVTGNTVADSVNGIVLHGAGGSVTGNTLTRLSDRGEPGTSTAPRGVGIFCRDIFGDPARITGNRVTQSVIGISAFFCLADLSGNVASENAAVGITRDRSSGLVERNVANANGGSGIVSFDSHGLFVDNVTNANAGAGLTIGDSDSLHGPAHVVMRHLANANGGVGISTTLAGVLDGGRNRAHANRGGAQCLGIVCNSR